MNSLDATLKKYLPKEKLDFVNSEIFGYTPSKLDFSTDAIKLSKSYNIALEGYVLSCSESDDSPRPKRPDQNSEPPNIVRVGIFQNSIVVATNEPIEKQKHALLELGRKAIEIASECTVNIFCFQELWNMPWGFCTQKKLPWIEFAEDAKTGVTTLLMRKLAKKHGVVIISSILERDENDFLWNCAVVVDADGEIVGKMRKNHIPISGKYNETSYYKQSSLGIPVFQTKFGKISLTICYDRHQTQNWYAHRLNQTQIVFNPCATVQTFSEPFWGIEARNAAHSNGYYVCAINRTGIEHFQVNDTVETTAGPFFGSSYITAPNGLRTPGLSVDRNGLLIGDLNLSDCKIFKEYPNDLVDISKRFNEIEGPKR